MIEVSNLHSYYLLNKKDTLAAPHEQHVDSSPHQQHFAASADRLTGTSPHLAFCANEEVEITSLGIKRVYLRSFGGNV